MITKFENHHFENQRVALDNCSFEKCTFKNCALVYSGSNAASLENCDLDSCNFEFEGAASNTLKFLHAMNHGGFRSYVYPTIVALSSPEPMQVTRS